MNLFEFNLALPITDPTWVFFLVLIIILFAPMILGRLHIPHIIGMILAGVLIGEHGFHVLDRDSSFELFGKVGLYYIMFLAGLEMDMEDFKKNRMKSVVFGLLTFLIPMALGIWSSMSMLGYGFLTAVLLASMYASHTLIAYPIISRYGLSRLRSVNITIGDYGHSCPDHPCCHRRNVQRHCRRSVLGIPCGESSLSGFSHHLFLPPYRTLVFPEV